MQYPNILSALQPVLHNEDIPVTEAAESYATVLNDEEENETLEPEPSIPYDEEYCPTSISEPQLITQIDVKDLEFWNFLRVEQNC